MSTFAVALTNLLTLLRDDQDLKAFCRDKWGKALTVRAVFRKRAELKAGDFPLILITRPEVRKKFRTGVRDGDHTVHLYALFHQDDRDKGPAELIEFEERIDDALLKDYTLGGTCINVTPSDSVNDEGKNHPSYCIVMEAEIQHRR